MIDETQRTPEKQNPANDDNTAETPIVPKSRSTSANEKKASKYAQTAKSYVSAAFKSTSAWLVWLTRWFLKALRSPDFWLASATVAIAISTGIYTYYARKQWSAMNGQLEEMKKSTKAATRAADEAKQANNLTRESLTTLQRAFVFPNIQGLTMQGNDQQSIETIIVNWVNSGDTPTRMFHAHVSNSNNTNGPLPDNFTYPDLWLPGAPHVNTDAVVGPKGSASIIGDSLTLPILTEAFNHKRRIYIWGWATCYDVFKDTPMYVTKFCSEMFVLGMQSAGGQTTINSKFDNCAHYNCYDEECK